MNKLLLTSSSEYAVSYSMLLDVPFLLDVSSLRELFLQGGDFFLRPSRAFVPAQSFKGGAPREIAGRVRKLLSLEEMDPLPPLLPCLEKLGCGVLLYRRFPGVMPFYQNVQPVFDHENITLLVDVSDDLSVERWIFFTICQLGIALGLDKKASIRFASSMLLPKVGLEKSIRAVLGERLVDKVLRVKKLYKVSYRTLLHEMMLSSHAVNKKDLWIDFHRQFFKINQDSYDTILSSKKNLEPGGIEESEFFGSVGFFAEYIRRKERLRG